MSPELQLFGQPPKQCPIPRSVVRNPLNAVKNTCCIVAPTIWPAPITPSDLTSAAEEAAGVVLKAREAIEGPRWPMFLKDDDNMVKTINCVELNTIRKTKTTGRERNPQKISQLNNGPTMPSIIM